jgi:hypothetical protein
MTMHGFRFRTVAAAAVAGGSLLALAACGPLGSSASDSKDGGKKADSTATASVGGDGSGIAHAVTALDLVKKKTSGAHSAKIQEKITVGTTMSISSSGVMDWTDGLQGAMSIRYDGGSAAQQLKDAGLDGTMQARYLPDAFYANMGPAMAEQLGGKHWIMYRYEDLGKLTGGSGTFMKDALQNGNPVKGVDAALASPDVENLGSATVHGVQTTHYHSTLTAGELSGQGSANLSAADQADLKKLLDKSGITSESVDLWVSRDNLPVQVTTRASTANGVITTTCYYSDFDTPVHTTAPAASDTADFAELMDQQQ